jgi:hypothetical protein
MMTHDDHLGESIHGGRLQAIASLEHRQPITPHDHIFQLDVVPVLQ